MVATMSSQRSKQARWVVVVAMQVQKTLFGYDLDMLACVWIWGPSNKFHPYPCLMPHGKQPLPCVANAFQCNAMLA
jgi:hypothetical protein